MASARKTRRQVPPKEAPRSVEGTPALQPAQPLDADRDRRWPAVSAVAPTQDGQHPDSPSAIRTQPEPLLVHNLLNDLTGLGSLLVREVRQGSWLNAYLLATGMNQIVEDYLHPDPYFLGKAADYLARIRPPAGPLAARTARGIATAMARIHSHQRPARDLLDWHADLAAFVQQLSDIVAAPPAATTAPREALLAWGEALLRPLGRFPARLRREVLRLPSCFRSFDQQPADVARLVRDFAQRWPDRRRPLVVVGLRASGSYLAPLYAAHLKVHGYQDVRVLTMRPGRRLLKPERALLQAVSRRGGLALLTDDPPVSGGSLAQAAADLERVGVPAQAIILLLQLFGSRDTLPPRLQRYAAVLLPWEEWTIHEQLAPTAVQSALADLLAPARTVRAIERLPLPPRTVARGHTHALYRVQLVDREGGRHREQTIFVTGAGLGYFGEHALAVARTLPGFLPEVYGFRAGLLYRAWLPEERRLSSIRPGTEAELAAAMVAYIVARHRALAVEEDVSPRLIDRLPVWEAASNLLSRAFGRGWLLVRLPVVDPTVKRLLRCQRPSVVDGSMSAAHWFAAEREGGQLLKVDVDERAFSNRNLSCYDPVFDLASLAASVDLAGLAARAPNSTLPRQLRDTYHNLLAEPIDEERWLLYQFVHLWDQQRTHASDQPGVRRALSRALQRYFAALYFQDVPAPSAGALCALDIDGVLETTPLGFPGMTPAAALTVRALTLHGYRPVLATGRSLDEVRERCAAYHLAGGVGEYGAVVYNHGTGGVREVLSASDRDALDQLRAVLGDSEGVHLDPDYRYCVRAYRFNAAGQRRSLSPEIVAMALARSGAGGRIRPIAGDAQTDFMVAGIDKGTGLRLLAADLGVEDGGEGKPLALAVGDTVSDLPMFKLAARAFAPANAGSDVRSAGVTVLQRPYQSGLALAAAHLLGHPPGRCPICRGPRLSADAHLLLTILAAQETGTWGMVRQALLLAARVWTLTDVGRRQGEVT
jgi:hydroxymethylpyrimidine pyrophosphatase-like HAD family hydrolase